MEKLMASVVDGQLVCPKCQSDEILYCEDALLVRECPVLELDDTGIQIGEPSLFEGTRNTPDIWLSCDKCHQRLELPEGIKLDPQFLPFQDAF
jgi:hypothetical protein